MKQEAKDLGKMRSAVGKFERVLIDLEEVIKKSPYKIGFLAEKLNLSRTAFYLKRKNSNFTPGEIKSLIEILEKPEK